jgi:hypothetical protein
MTSLRGMELKPVNWIAQNVSTETIVQFASERSAELPVLRKTRIVAEKRVQAAYLGNAFRSGIKI